MDKLWRIFTHGQTMEKSDEDSWAGLLLNTKLRNKDSSSEKTDFMNKSVSHYKITGGKNWIGNVYFASCGKVKYSSCSNRS